MRRKRTNELLALIEEAESEKPTIQEDRDEILRLIHLDQDVQIELQIRIRAYGEHSLVEQAIDCLRDELSNARFLHDLQQAQSAAAFDLRESNQLSLFELSFVGGEDEEQGEQENG